MESVIGSIKDDTSSKFIASLQEMKLRWSRSSAVSRTTRLRSLSLDSKKRSFDGVGHQQCQGRHVFAVILWTPRNEALMESVISSVKDDTSSQLCLDSKKRSFDGVGHQLCQGPHIFAFLFLDTKKRSFDGVGHHQCQRRHVVAVYFGTPRNEAQYQGRHVFAVSF